MPVISFPRLTLSITLPRGELHFNFAQSEEISKTILLLNGEGKCACLVNWLLTPAEVLAGVNLVGASEFFNGGKTN